MGSDLVHADLDDGGRWVPTFASDSQPGDTIRLAQDGPTRLIVDRDYPPSGRDLTLTFIERDKRVDVLVGKTQGIEIWDTDGSVSQRVLDLSAQGIR